MIILKYKATIQHCKNGNKHFITKSEICNGVMEMAYFYVRSLQNSNNIECMRSSDETFSSFNPVSFDAFCSTCLSKES